MTSTRTFSGKWKNSASRAACKSSFFHKYLMLSTYFADSILLHCFVTWVPSIKFDWSKTKENQYSNKQLLSVWGDTLPWVLWRVAYWFHSKTSCINCILSIEMCAKQSLEHPFFCFSFLSFIFFFPESTLSKFYSLVCSYSKLVCAGVLNREANPI